MVWRTENGSETDFLRCIVALILSMAGLAERAAAAPRSSRRRAIRALSDAEIVVLCLANAELAGGLTWSELVGAGAGPAKLPSDFGYRHADDPQSARLLALRLRMLALLLLGLWAELSVIRTGQARGFARRNRVGRILMSLRSRSVPGSLSDRARSPPGPLEKARSPRLTST